MCVKRVIRLCNLGIGLALVVVFLGAWTRLNNAGLGCPDWPGCYGQWVIPNDIQALSDAQQLYPDQPIVTAKGWLEMIHRYAAGLLGILVLGIAFAAWKNRKIKHYPLGYSYCLLLVVTVQAVFGMWTVTLKLLPQIVTLHLLGGLLTLSLLILLRQKLGSFRAGSMEYIDYKKIWVKLGVLLLFGQILLGGWTSSNYAGWACSEWLRCDSQQQIKLDFDAGFSLPPLNGKSHEGGLKPHDARAAIQVVHRIGALTISLYLLALCAFLSKEPVLKRPLIGIGVTVLMQNSLGMLNVALGLPTYLAIAHHAGAVLLLVCLLWLYAQVVSSREEICYA